LHEDLLVTQDVGIGNRDDGTWVAKEILSTDLISTASILDVSFWHVVAIQQV
jgi:hypothetical protein